MKLTEKQMIEIFQTVLREGSGGHSLTNGKGDELWSPKHPINISEIVRRLRK